MVFVKGKEETPNQVASLNTPSLCTHSTRKLDTLNIGATLCS